MGHRAARPPADRKTSGMFFVSFVFFLTDFHNAVLCNKRKPSIAAFCRKVSFRPKSATQLANGEPSFSVCSLLTDSVSVKAPHRCVAGASVLACFHIRLCLYQAPEMTRPTFCSSGYLPRTTCGFEAFRSRLLGRLLSHKVAVARLQLPIQLKKPTEGKRDLSSSFNARDHPGRPKIACL